MEARIKSVEDKGITVHQAVERSCINIHDPVAAYVDDPTFTIWMRAVPERRAAFGPLATDCLNGRSVC